MVFYGGLLLLVVALYALHTEGKVKPEEVPSESTCGTHEGGCSEKHGRKRRSDKEGGDHYGGGGYGAGGGHYAIGFSPDELVKICKDDTACTACFENSQTITDEQRTLKLAASCQCVKEYLSNNAWASECATYGQRALEKDATNVNPNVMRMYSFCVRTATEFSDSEKCDTNKPWKEFLGCFSGEGKGEEGEKEGEKDEGTD